MDRKNAWIIGCAIVAGFLLVGLTQVFAQRFPGDGRAPGGIGRYQVVRANADVTIILDTTNGDLYRAVPNDIRAYSLRPRGPATGGQRPTDRGFTDKDKPDSGPPNRTFTDKDKPDSGSPRDFRKDADRKTDDKQDGFRKDLKQADAAPPKDGRFKDGDKKTDVPRDKPSDKDSRFDKDKFGDKKVDPPKDGFRKDADRPSDGKPIDKGFADKGKFDDPTKRVDKFSDKKDADGPPRDLPKRVDKFSDK